MLTPSKKRTDVTATKRIVAPWAVILPAIPPRRPENFPMPRIACAAVLVLHLLFGALDISRGAEPLHVRIDRERAFLSGQAVTVLEGTLTADSAAD